MKRLVLASLTSVIAAVALVLPAQSAPEVDLHEIDFYIHVELVDASVGRDLAFWQGVVDDAIARGNQLLLGANGPADTPCCTKMAASASLATFGTPGDGLDVIDSLADQQAIAALGTPGSRAFLVDMIGYCGGPSGAIGCANVGSCGNPNDDPNLWLYVEVFGFIENEISTTLPAVLAHERGHNACLNRGLQRLSAHAARGHHAGHGGLSHFERVHGHALWPDPDLERRDLRLSLGSRRCDRGRCGV